MPALVFKLALNHLMQKPIARIALVFSVASILLINAMIYLLFQSVSSSLKEIKASQYVTAYIDPNVPPNKEEEVLSAVKKIEGVKSAQLVSKDAFVENFSKFFPQLSKDLLTLEADSIPRFIKVKAEEGATQDLTKALSMKVGIDQVEVNQNKYAGLIGALSVLRKIAVVLFMGMTAALLCILLNHFKLGTVFQNQLQKTLSALGAKSSYSFFVFLIEGVVEGFLGGLLAAAGLFVIARIFEKQLSSMFVSIGYQPYSIEMAQFAVLALVLLGAGILSGMIGSIWASIRIGRFQRSAF